MPTALITGASRGLGRALALALARRGWSLVVDARGAEALDTVADGLRVAGAASVHAFAGDVAEREHLAQLVRAAPVIDLVVANASTLGPSPLPGLADYPLEALRRVIEVNVVAPLALVQLALPRLHPDATILMVSSDAAVEAYEGWGGYGASKAALDQLSAVLAAEHPKLRVHAVDPGDMRTRMQAEAFPGEDISDRPEPETVVPHLLTLLDARLPSGRRRAKDVQVAAA
ncbi:MAG: SDR family oxidoreductase [Actinomycetota bacterium]|nr:SDR family oxidoreductase [Actinomycetota bacterium]